VTLALSPDPYLWPCDLDAAQFEAAILNLTLNARDAMPGGGALTIETRRVERTAEEVDPADFWPAGHYVAVAVSDTGTGMSPHVRAHAFEPFFTTKDAGRGSGLGLSQVYGFVKQMGGHVAITSEEGKGTTVTLFLPRAATGAASEPRAKPAAPVDGAGETVLVVEDDALVRQSVVAMLAASGYRVLTASDGREALQILESVERVDLLFSDVVMPQGMSGVDVARAAQRLRGGIKVLLTSGYAAEVLAARGANGNFPIVAKPYGHSELAERVRLALADGREVA
jgi:CheY-like chemotaxis protein